MDVSPEIPSSSATSTNVFAEEGPGGATQSGSYYGDATAVHSTETSSSSGTNWEGIIVLLLLIFGVVILLSFPCAVCSIHTKQGQVQKEKEEGLQEQAPPHDEEAAVSGRPSQPADALTPDRYHKVRRWMQFTATFAAVVGFAISIVTNTSCRLIGHNGDYNDSALYTLGIWSVSHSSEEGVCSSVYPPGFVIDPSYRTARAFAVLAAILGGGSLLFLLRSLLGNPLRFVLGLRITGCLSFLSALFLGLSLMLVFHSENCDVEISGFDCKLDDAGIFTLSMGLAYWFLAGVALMILPGDVGSMSYMS